MSKRFRLLFFLLVSVVILLCYKKKIVDKLDPYLDIVTQTAETIGPLEQRYVENTNQEKDIVPSADENGAVDIYTVPQHESGNVSRFEEHFATQQAVCKDMKRLGGRMPTFGRPDPDGAWWVCFDKEVGFNSDDCIVYSFGIKDDWSFDEHMARFGCQVFSFDPSIGSTDHLHSPGVHFYNVGLSDVDREGDKNTHGKDGWKMRTLESIMKQLNHTEKIIFVLKMDIEGSEWISLAQMMKSDILRSHVKVLTVEFHLNKGGNKYNHYDIVKWLERQGFLITNLHRNTNCRPLLRSVLCKHESGKTQN